MPTTCPKCGSAEIRVREKRNDWFCDACDHRWTVEASENGPNSSQEQLPRIFLSYGRGDDEPFVERLHRELTERGFDIWWDRVDMPSRKLTFHHEIREAIAARQRLLLVVGPHAVSSDYVRQEWQFALEADKVVTPILRLGDYPLVPDELKLLHCEDFRDDGRFEFHLENLARQLAEPPPPLGKLISVPSLPPHYLARQDRLLVLRDALRSDLERPVVITGEAARIGIHGMGGIGKSVLASALAHDRLIREAFPDGIIWVALGSQPDTAELQRRVHRELGGEGDFQTATEGRTNLKDLLAEKSVLLILDDVWRRSDADDFDVLGPRCRALVTTRDAGLLTSLGGTHHVVELLTDQEALHLLAMAVGLSADSLPAEAAEIVQECGRLPLAVALCGGMLQAGTPWPDVLAALREHELEFLSDEHAAETQHRSMWRAIEVGVAALEVDVRQRLAELSVFPPGEPIPDAAVMTLWEHTGGLSQRQTRQLLVQLKQRSLVQISRAPETPAEQLGEVSLHDLIHDFATRSAQRYYQDSTQLHTQMIEAYRAKCPGGWHGGANDGYYFQHLCDHFIAAEDWEGLEAVLTDLPFLEAKVAAGMAFELAGDFTAAVEIVPEDRSSRRRLRLLEEALRRDLHFIARHAEDYPQGLFQCLWNTGWWYDSPAAADHYDPPEGGWPAEGPPWQRQGPKLCELLDRWRTEKQALTVDGKALGGAERLRHWLRSARPPILPLGSAQLAQLTGHTRKVTSVAFSPDGRRIASGSEDRTVRVWDSASAEPIAQLTGHTGWVNSVAFSPDGRHIVSASGDHKGDNTVRVWDADNAEQIAQLAGHTSSVYSVAFSPDGRRIASASHFKVRVWDYDSGEQIAQLTGHTSWVSSVAFSPDGRRVVSGSEDQTVRVWDSGSGEPIAQLTGHTGWVSSVAFSPDGRRIASGSRDNTVRVWDADNGEQIAQLTGHTSWVLSVAFSPDGRRIASGSGDTTVRVWDADSGEQISQLTGHTEGVTSVAFSPDGRRIASGSYDYTVRVWDANSGEPIAQPTVHASSVESVAFSPDGRRIASGSRDNTVRVWDADSGEQIAQLTGHTDLVSSVAFSPDGRRIVTGGGYMDKTVRVWDADSGEQIAQLTGHTSYVYSVAFSPDERRITSGGGSGDRMVRVWDADSGECLKIRSGDAGAIVAGPASYPYRLISRGLESLVESATTGETIAWFPVALSRITTHPSGRKWAARHANHVYILELAGDAATAEDRPS